MFAVLYCTIFCTPSFQNSGTSIASLDPKTVQLLALSTLSAMFTGACGLPEKLSFALVLHLNVIHMTAKPTLSTLAVIQFCTLTSIV